MKLFLNPSLGLSMAPALFRLVGPLSIVDSINKQFDAVKLIHTENIPYKGLSSWQLGSDVTDFENGRSVGIFFLLCLRELFEEPKGYQFKEFNVAMNCLISPIMAVNIHERTACILNLVLSIRNKGKIFSDKLNKMSEAFADKIQKFTSSICAVDSSLSAEEQLDELLSEEENSCRITPIFTNVDSDGEMFIAEREEVIAFSKTSKVKNCKPSNRVNLEDFIEVESGNIWCECDIDKINMGEKNYFINKVMFSKKFDSSLYCPKFE
ncbi:hypothetical protein OAB57_03060 [Bacteriovoracaceae bacterium]|nr:hypothetical protein [Bacteriovoracaceae bacterium]